MNGIEAIGAIGSGADPVARLAAPAAQAAPAGGGVGFFDMLAGGMRQAEAKVETADALVRRFAVDDSVPLHQVTFALEEARLSVELAMQVRTRLVESYRELMNMQL